MEHDVRIVFTAGTRWISRLIRWALRSPVSHVFIEYPSQAWGGRWAAEATKGGVRKVQAKKSRHHVKAEFRCKVDLHEGMVQAAKYVGVKYDYTGAFFIGVVALSWRLLKVKIRHPLRRSSSQFCSEFIAYIFQKAGVQRTAAWDPALSGPGRLYRFCLKETDQFAKIEESAEWHTKDSG
ncbi:MAG: hypothetical protein DRJ03_01790 [Chloroflexi bacterium]|nr:MAG: hypothetical protein DRJ03_01790 [Chloroflexota bacterium]